MSCMLRTLVYLRFNAFKVDCCSSQGFSSCLMPPGFLEAEGSIPVEGLNPCPLTLATLLRLVPLLLHVCKHCIAVGSRVWDLGMYGALLAHWGWACAITG